MTRRRRSSLPLLAVTVALVSLTGQVLAQVPASVVPQAGRAGIIVLSGATIIDGTGAPPVENGWVRIEGDRITGVGRGAPPATPGATVTDLKGYTLVPGLSDMHVHLQDKVCGPWTLSMLLAHGVTNVRDMGTPLEDQRAIRTWMQQQRAVPHLTTSGIILNGSARDGLLLIPGDKLAAQLEAVRASGARFVKSHNYVSLAAAEQIAAFGKSHDMPWIGHVPITMTSLAAIDLGLTSIEHMQIRTSEVVTDPEVASQYPMGMNDRARDSYWASFDENSPVVLQTLAAWEKRKDKFFHCPTLVAQYHLAYGDVKDFLTPEAWNLATPRHQQQWQTRGAKMPGELDAAGWAAAKRAVRKEQAFVRLAHARGVRIITGTDFGVYREVPGVSLLRELEMLAEAGLTPAEVIRASTSRAAEALRVKDRGTIAQGQLADLVIVRGNVAADMRAIRQIDQVVLAGQFFTRADLLAQAEKLRVLDKPPATAGQ